MTSSTNKIFLGISLFGIVAIVSLVYFFKKKFKEEVEDSDFEDTKSDDDIKTNSANLRSTKTNIQNLEIQSNNVNSSNKETNSNFEPLNSMKNNFEITSHKPVEIITNKETLHINIIKNLDLISTKKDKKYIIEETQSDGNQISQEKQNLYKKKERTNPKLKISNNINSSLKKTLINKISNKDNFKEKDGNANSYLNNSGCLIDPKLFNTLNNINDSLFNFDEFENMVRKQTFKELHDISFSLENSFEPADIHKLHGNDVHSDSAGYKEEDEDSMLMHESTGRKNSEECSTPFKYDLKRSDSFTNFKKSETAEKNFNKTFIISSNDELSEILFGKMKNYKYKFLLEYVDKEILGMPRNPNCNEINIIDKEIIIVLKPNHLLLILNYLYDELHSGLIELSDKFTDERRKFFESDQNNYIKLINFFLRKKEEFFLCVLSDVMNKLNITQKVLDNTFFYYMNVVEDSEEIQIIRAAYDKVYHAGIKYSIAPKNLNRIKLKEILSYQCEIYEKLMTENENFEPDVIEIMVTDYVYIEYGYDREAIRAAIIKNNIQEDPHFKDVLKRLESFQNNTFLNI